MRKDIKKERIQYVQIYRSRKGPGGLGNGEKLHVIGDRHHRG